MLRNDIQPSFFPSANRVIVIGDIHGDVHTFMKIMYATGVFNQNLEWIAEPKDTIVIQLGDQVDSASRGGRPSWETVPDIEMLYLTDRLDSIARMKGGRVLSLIGNHEMMNVLGDFSYVSPESLQKVDRETRSRMFRPGGTLCNILAKRNVLVRIGHHLFCHGGVLPHHLTTVNKHFYIINDVLRKFLQNIPLTLHEQAILSICVIGHQSITWTRMYVELLETDRTVLQDAVQQVLNDTHCQHIFTGHNTVGSVSVLLDGKIILTDVGMSRAYPTNTIQVVEIRDISTPQEQIRILQLQ